MARAVLDEQALDDAAGRAGLDRHQRLAQHLLGEGLHLVDGLGEAHAALVAGLGLLELALAAAAGMDLRLHHPDRPRQRLRGLHGLVDRECRRALRQRHAVLPQQLLGLIFVDVHESPMGREFGDGCNDRQSASWYTICQIRRCLPVRYFGRARGYTALREAIISISTLAPIGRAATAMVERAG